MIIIEYICSNKTDRMDQDIINVSYSDNMQPQVITIDLPHPPTVTHQSNVQTIIYNQDGHTMTTLQPNDPTTLEECGQIEETHEVKYEETNITSNTSNNEGEIENENPNADQQTKGAPNKPEETSTNEANDETTSNGSKSLTRFKWTKEKSQVAMNLTKYGCKPKIISVAVGCSLRTAQKFVETVTPKMEGESFKNYEIRRRGRKSKDVNQRLEAIREVLSRDATKTQVEIAADLKVSNTTVCRDLKRIGASWKEKKGEDQEGTPKRTRKSRQSSNKNKTSPVTRKNKTRGRQKRAKKEKTSSE